MRILLTVILLTVFAACGGESATGIKVSTEGSYTLRTVNGAPLPYLIREATTQTSTYEIMDATVTLNIGGTFTYSDHVRFTFNGKAEILKYTDAGTFTLSGTGISMRSNKGDSLLSGTLSANTLTLVAQGTSYVYTK